MKKLYLSFLLSLVSLSALGQLYTKEFPELKWKAQYCMHPYKSNDICLCIPYDAMSTTSSAPDIKFCQSTYKNTTIKRNLYFKDLHQKVFDEKNEEIIGASSVMIFDSDHCKWAFGVNKLKVAEGSIVVASKPFAKEYIQEWEVIPIGNLYSVRLKANPKLCIAATEGIGIDKCVRLSVYNGSKEQLWTMEIIRYVFQDELYYKEQNEIIEKYKSELGGSIWRGKDEYGNGATIEYDHSAGIFTVIEGNKMLEYEVRRALLEGNNLVFETCDKELTSLTGTFIEADFHVHEQGKILEWSMGGISYTLYRDDYLKEHISKNEKKFNKKVTSNRNKVSKSVQIKKKIKR